MQNQDYLKLLVEQLHSTTVATLDSGRRHGYNIPRINR